MFNLDCLVRKVHTTLVGDHCGTHIKQITHACRDGSMATAAEEVATGQPQVQQPKATGGWGGSAAGAADFLNRLAQAEERDASSLEGPTPSPSSPKGSPKGPRVRHLSPSGS